MGRRERGQGQFFYAFDLDKVVPADHLVRQIDGVLDLDWVHKELAPYYSHTGRPSIDPVLMIRMLIVGYVFAMRSERRLCSKVQVNLPLPGRGPRMRRASTAVCFAIVPQSAMAISARSKCSAAPTRLCDKFLVILMRMPAMSRAHWPKPRLSNNHGGSAKRSRCILLT